MPNVISPTLLLEATQEAGRIAGAVALRHFRTELDVETKADGSPVTIADREAESVGARLDRAPLSRRRDRG